MAVLAAAGVATSSTAAQAARWSSTAAEVADGAPASVLGLETDDSRTGVELTQALRRAFARRGLSGGDEANLSELRLALGCRSDDPSCLSRGGETLGTRRLIYGSLRKAETSGWTLQLTLLEVESEHASSTTIALTTDQLDADTIDATAERIADELAPDSSTGTRPASGTQAEPPPARERAPLGSDDDAPAPRRRALTFGLERPTPRWKWVGFGVSAGVMVVSVGGVVGTSLYLDRSNGGFHARLLELAAESLQDSNPANDVNPNLPEGINLCEYADRPDYPDPRTPGDPVRNGKITALCNDAEKLRRIQVGLLAIAGVSTLSTAVFTGLLLIHRAPASERSAWRRHRMLLGVEPSPGGAALRLAGRF